MPAMPRRVFVISPELHASHVASLLLKPQRGYGSDCNGASEIIRGDLCGL